MKKKTTVIKTDSFELRLFFGSTAVIAELIFIILLLFVRISVHVELLKTLSMLLLALNFIFVIYLLFKGFTITSEEGKNSKEKVEKKDQKKPTQDRTVKQEPVQKQETPVAKEPTPAAGSPIPAQSFDEIDWDKFFDEPN